MLLTLPKSVLKRISHRLLSPTLLVEELDLRSGNCVLEIGLPVGFFAPATVSKVGEDGCVYVAGPSHESFEKLHSLTSRKNVRPVLLKDLLTRKSIDEHSIDLIILTNLLSSSYSASQFCMSLNYFLKANAQVVLIDWDIAIEHVGPKMDKRVSKKDAIKLLTRCGLTFSRMLNVPGYHYGLVFSLRSD